VTLVNFYVLDEFLKLPIVFFALGRMGKTPAEYDLQKDSTPPTPPSHAEKARCNSSQSWIEIKMTDLLSAAYKL
jgi:hypothetical protein